MVKISDQEQIRYREKTERYRELIAAALANGEKALEEINRNPADSALKRLSLAEDMLDLSSYYIIQDGISHSMLKTRNEEALNNARKSIYQSVFYLEQIVTTLLDAPYSEYEKDIEQIAPLNVEQRYFLIRKMGLAIDLLKNAYGENSKWKWSFVELEGRYATVAKNIIDLKNMVSNIDPRSPYYAPAVCHLRLAIKLLTQAANRYRERYELFTKRVSDFEVSINFLSALLRIYLILGDQENIQDVKRKLHTWQNKLKNDILRNRSPEAPAAG
ncbi:MAG: hypothetical protein LBP20_11480 [Treponema sp.]|jgi:hypothetical protein|nr:hypothetical protein [Treponema sp.]